MGQHRGIIPLGQTRGTGPGKHLGGQRPQGTGKPHGLGRLYRQRGVFFQQSHVGARRKVAAQGAGHAVAGDPALGAGRRHHLQGALTIQAQTLTQLPTQPSPSLLHGTSLPASSEAIVASMSGDSKKRMRWRMRKLEDVGPISFMHSRSHDEIVAVIEAFRRQKKVRIDAMGVSAGFDIDLVAAFMEEAALSQEPGIELYALKAGEQIVAMYGGVSHAGAFHAMVNSFDTDPEISRTSPGELVTIHLLQALCNQGLKEFDLGVGEAAYKDKWCDRHEALVDSFIGVTAKGKAYALAQSTKQSLKRNIKQSEWLWPLAKKIRARLRGKG